MVNRLAACKEIHISGWQHEGMVSRGAGIVLNNLLGKLRALRKGGRLLITTVVIGSSYEWCFRALLYSIQLPTKATPNDSISKLRL